MGHCHTSKVADSAGERDKKKKCCPVANGRGEVCHLSAFLAGNRPELDNAARGVKTVMQLCTEGVMMKDKKKSGENIWETITFGDSIRKFRLLVIKLSRLVKNL